MKMTDRELLERAAKSIRIELMHPIDGGTPCDKETLLDWNPVKYDEDALQLLVRLRMWLDVNSSGQIKVGDDKGELVCISAGKDPHASTRRAITQAAAQIGDTVDVPDELT